MIYGVGGVLYPDMDVTVTFTVLGEKIRHVPADGDEVFGLEILCKGRPVRLVGGCAGGSGVPLSLGSASKYGVLLWDGGRARG